MTKSPLIAVLKVKTGAKSPHPSGTNQASAVPESLVYSTTSTSRRWLVLKISS